MCVETSDRENVIMPMKKTMTAIQHKTLDSSVEEDDRNRIVAKLTTPSIDRDGEVLIPQGMNSKDFEKNPILFYHHNYENPVGTVKNLKRTEDAVFGELVFAKKPEGYTGDFFPEFVEALVRQGIVKGVSVGFMPETNGARMASKADRQRYGNGIKRVYNKWKLLEVSVAPLPANQDALVQAVGKGLVSRRQCKTWLGMDIEPPEPKVRLRYRPKIRLLAKDPTQDRIEKSVARAIARSRGQLYT